MACISATPKGRKSLHTSIHTIIFPLSYFLIFLRLSFNICYFKDISFPAITICSVNKVERERLIKSIKGIVAVQNATNVNNQFDYESIDLEAISFMIESLVRYDKVNFSDPYWQWVSKNSPKIKSSDLLKLFRWVS